MKKVEATVSPNSLNSVLNALTKAGFSNLTYFEGKGRSHQKGEKKMWRGQEYREIYERIIQVKVIVENNDISRVINIIKNASKDDENMIYITEVDEITMNKIMEERVEVLVRRTEEVV